MLGVRCSKVPALVQGWLVAPIIRMLRDETLQRSLIQLMGDLPQGDLGVDLLGWMEASGTPAAWSPLDGVDAVSLSLSPVAAAEQAMPATMARFVEEAVEASSRTDAKSVLLGRWHLCLVMDFDEAAAALTWKDHARKLADQLGLDILPEPMPLTRRERFGFGEGEATVSRFGWAEGVDTVGVLTYAVVGSRGALLLGAEPAPPSAGGRQELAIFADEPAAWSEPSAQSIRQAGGSAEEKAREAEAPNAVVEVFLRGGLLKLPDFFSDARELPFVGSGWLDPMLPMAMRGGRWRIIGGEGGFHVQGLVEEPRPMGGPLFGGSPFDPGDVTLADARADVVHWTSVDPAVAGRLLGAGLDKLGVSSAAAKQLEPALGRSAALYLLPLRGLATAPDLYLVASLKDPSMAQRFVQGFVKDFNEASPAGLKMQASSYRGGLLASLVLGPQEGVALATIGLRPTLVVAGDAMALTTSVSGAKRWIRRRGGSAEKRPVHPGWEAADVPETALAVSYGRWSKVLGDAYGFAKELTPLLDFLGSAAPDVDWTALPEPEALTRFFAPGSSWVRLVAERPQRVGTHFDVRTSFGPVSGVVLFGLGATVIAPMLFEQLDSAMVQTTKEDLRRLEGLIFDFMLENGEAPEKLELLAGGSEGFRDPWGNAFRYERTSDSGFRLWSLEPGA
ncbi:MAG: hypothetical protein AAGG01_08685 [Planctomycetota bacterium]